MAKKGSDSSQHYGVMEANLEFIKRDISEIKESMKELKKTYVTNEEFEPVKRIVYGLVTLILTGVVGALITLVVRS